MKEMFGFLREQGVEITGFSFSEYHSSELNLMKPALEKLGFTEVRFFTMERDSFGPLLRGCVAVDKQGKTQEFYYG